ncbi:uncharacterized protein [Pyrus communis]|uniref:uncharacterized protein n=1 Tax=Pyrus communis TaxID=23211 RepID=UPI0035C0F2C6
MDQSNVGVVKQHVEKPEKFKGVDFKHWQQKMLFYLTTLNLGHVITFEAPKTPEEGDIPAEILQAIEAWTHSEFLCRNYILNALDDSLYDVYSSYKTAKELWESLDKKYKSEVASSKKFVIGKFLNYKMSDTKSVVRQLILKLRVDEDHHKNEKYDVLSLEAKANVVEGNDSYKARHHQKNKGKDAAKKALTVVKGKTFKKIKGSCWVYGKTGTIRHVCADWNLFVTYQFVDGGENLYMGNATASVVAGKGKVTLKLISEKELSLNNVLHIPDIRKNLISGSLLSNKGFNIVFESDKFVITKGGVYVGKGYLAEGLFKLNVLSANAINNNNKPNVSFAYLIESSTLLPKCSMNKVSKYIHINTILESAEAEFVEEIFPYKDRSYILNKKVHEVTTRNDDDNHASTFRVQSQDLETRKSKRAKIAKDFGPDFLTFVTEEEPQTYKAALESSEAPYWKEAIQSEIESIMQNNTWELVNLPPGNKPIGHKWNFKRKLRSDGTIDKYKARLVAKRYRKKEGLDYFNTYSPVARITSIRLLIAITSVYNLEIHQMDVKTAFLNGELDKEIYMEQPEGFIVKGQEKKVCKLIKSLYGLKQAPKQ